MKKSNEISLTKLDLTFVPEDFGLEDREHSSTLAYSILTLNVTKVKPYENAMKLMSKEKKREYSSRTLNVEQGTFTPLVFSATRGMEGDFSMFFKKLSQPISIKRKGKLSG